MSAVHHGKGIARPTAALAGLMNRLKRVSKELGKETDRGAVVLAAAYIDDVLKGVLRNSLKPPRKAKDELLGTNGPLSDFGARMELCYRLGLIDKKMLDALHQIRKVRNDFAHKAFLDSVDEQSHSDRIASLVALVEKEDLYQSALKEMGNKEQGSELRAAALAIAFKLEMTKFRTSTPPPA